MDYEYYMKKAYEQALFAYEQNEVPIGCVIVLNEEIIGYGFNKRNTMKNALGHAEILAIDMACKKVGDWRVEGATLFVTVEPCPMCAGAIVQARIKEVVFGARNKKAGCAGSILNILNEERFNHRVEVVEGVFKEECAKLMSDFFKKFRKKNEEKEIVEGVIFDLDGTIANSLYVWHKVDIDFFKKRGMNVPEGYCEKINSVGFEDAAIITKRDYGFTESVEEIMEEWFNMAIDEYAKNVKPKNGFKEYARRLKEQNIKIALCTASPDILYEPFLKNNGLYDFFDVLVNCADVKKSKNTPEIYEYTCERLNVKPQNCVVFEDICVAMESAKRAGTFVVAVENEDGNENKDEILRLADMCISDFSEEIAIGLKQNQKN